MMNREEFFKKVSDILIRKGYECDPVCVSEYMQGDDIEDMTPGKLADEMVSNGYFESEAADFYDFMDSENSGFCFSDADPGL